MTDKPKGPPSDLILPKPTFPPMPNDPGKTCHKFFVPVFFPQQDRLNPNAVQMVTNVSNVFCIKEKCMMWNEEAGECWDVSAARGQAQSGDYAYAMRNNVMIEDPKAG